MIAVPMSLATRATIFGTIDESSYLVLIDMTRYVITLRHNRYQYIHHVPAFSFTLKFSRANYNALLIPADAPW
jgi:hypothetical protein